jgi:transcriptional regulator with XRE-family HTH domain
MSTVTPMRAGGNQASKDPTGERDALSFGTLMKEWRSHRRLSQLQLAVNSGISQRHISFVETGKAQPSRQTVLELADTLDVPLRERNALLQRAGYSAAYPDAPLAEADLGLFQEALDQMLAQHEPYPAMLLDGRWRLVGSNGAALRFFSQFIDPALLLATAPDTADAPFPVVDLCLREDGLKPHFENWQEVVFSFLLRARAALLANPRDQEMAELIERLQNHPEAPESWQAPNWSSAPPPAITMRLRKGQARYALFTMLAHFGSPQQTVAQDLSVELFFPADEATRDHLREA